MQQQLPIICNDHVIRSQLFINLQTKLADNVGIGFISLENNKLWPDKTEKARDEIL